MMLILYFILGNSNMFPYGVIQCSLFVVVVVDDDDDDDNNV